MKEQITNVLNVVIFLAIFGALAALMIFLKALPFIFALSLFN